MPCPLVKQEQAVNVIRHHHEGGELDAREVSGNLIPTFGDKLADSRESHLACAYCSKERTAIV